MTTGVNRLPMPSVMKYVYTPPAQLVVVIDICTSSLRNSYMCCITVIINDIALMLFHTPFYIFLFRAGIIISILYGDQSVFVSV